MASKLLTFNGPYICNYTTCGHYHYPTFER